MNTYPAPEPRDIVWSNMSHSVGSIRVRELIALACMTLLLLFWLIPITALASLLSYKEIKKVMPWLGDLIDQNAKIRAIVQNSLPSVVMITMNSLVPFMLEGKSQGFQYRKIISLTPRSPHLYPGLSCPKLDRVFTNEEVCSLQ